MDDADKSTNDYHLRSKVRKLNTKKGAIISYHHHHDSLKRKYTIQHCPIEVLQMVFQYMSFQEISRTLRLVNKTFKLAAEDFLNRCFKKLGVRLKELIDDLERSLRVEKDDVELKVFCRLLNMVEIIYFQHEVLMATIWRHVYNRTAYTFSTCMHGGLILDLYTQFLYKFYCCPQDIYSCAIISIWDVPEEVKRIIKFTKQFCVFFDKLSEDHANISVNLSGCKIVDLLDCAPYCVKKIISETTTLQTFVGQYVYYFKNSWFVSVPIAKDGELDLKRYQYLMHLRIRRIVLAHTEMFMQQEHYKRELHIRCNPSIRKPAQCVYTGYGEIYDTFFCYGVMNDSCYAHKFNIISDDGSTPDEQDVDMDFVTDSTRSVPHLGITFNVTVTCPLTHMPYRLLKRDVKECTRKRRSKRLYFEITINFPGAKYVRILPVFRYSNIQKALSELTGVDGTAQNV